MNFTTLFLVLSTVITATISSPAPACRPSKTTFTSSTTLGPAEAFVALSPSDTYELTDNGLELHLQRPEGTVTTSKGVNDKLGDGATVNSTFSFLYGKVTYEVEAPRVAGVITAIILACEGDSHDEIDIEILGGDPTHWQSNSYSPASSDTQPLWGVFSGVHSIGNSSTISSTHAYSVKWTADSITWGIDGNDVRTLKKADTIVNGSTHFPFKNPLLLSMGIWDASNPLGTSEWGKGPINWKEAPSKIAAVIKSVEVECS
ncbi:concanavalin A-like lectin/glucanase [Sistotremastrum suecicum HHB10207 ss-3]|uniref:Concanavalin A-like lectin/glucanase n=1 Tax=Sistotremastrum suecicum HHB10207 ss-3 TaxID=1314776 RepID=A0A166HTP0_9AGAM|nr:concanavalin A-like lectin/glucanase [Sistotremastrum suecicum HHB10207 ss-3]